MPALEGALKLASHHRATALADRISAFIEQRLAMEAAAAELEEGDAYGEAAGGRQVCSSQADFKCRVKGNSVGFSGCRAGRGGCWGPAGASCFYVTGEGWGWLSGSVTLGCGAPRLSCGCPPSWPAGLAPCPMQPWC